MRMVLSATIALLVAIPISAQVGGGGGDEPPNNNDTPFKDRSYEVTGEARTTSRDPNGVDHDYDFLDSGGQEHDSVSASSAQGTMWGVCGGDMRVWHSPVGLICDSVASGSCHMAEVPQNPTRADYDATARTNLRSSNAHTTDTAPLVIKFTGYRSSVGGEPRHTCDGWGEVLITRAVDGSTKKYRVDLVPKGWKQGVNGEWDPVVKKKDFSWELEESLAPGDKINVTSVVQAKSEGSIDLTKSNVGLKIVVSVAAEENNPPPPPN